MGGTDYLLVFCLAYTAVSATNCPRGWFPSDDSCYLFGTYNLKFVEAEHFCRQHSGHLVEVSSAHENNFLKTFMKQLQPRYWWIGMTDKDIEAEWKWNSNNEEVNFTGLYPTDMLCVAVADWHSGLPGPSSWKDAKDCAFFDKLLQFTWDDITCDSTLITPVCEIRSMPCEEEPVIG